MLVKEAGDTLANQLRRNFAEFGIELVQQVVYDCYELRRRCVSGLLTGQRIVLHDTGADSVLRTVDSLLSLST